MRVLYIGNYKDGTGWGTYGLNQILALDTAGLDVACRAIKLNNYNAELPERIKELESNNFGGNVDIIIQNVLPHYMEYSGRFAKNIGLYMAETSNFISSTWANHINLMNEAWVPSKHNKECSRESKVIVPIKVVPTAVNVEKYKTPPPPLSLRNDFPDSFIFYTIGEFTSRKNIHTLLKAFHAEFDRDESVELLIKTTPTGMKNPQQDIQKYLNDIKAGLKLHSRLEDYKQELVIFQNLSERDLDAVHTTGDCFISASHGEAICLPAIDAMGFGKPIIAPNHTGFKEYLEDTTRGGNAFLVDVHRDKVFGMTDTFQDLGSARESWYNMTIKDLQKAMREMYKTHKNYLWDNDMTRFSHRHVGNILKEILEV